MITPKKKIDVFKSTLDKFETKELKRYCEDMIAQIPTYIFKIPSSSTGKYHNKTQGKEHGQIYHTLMVCEILDYVLELDFVKKNPHSSKVLRDCMRCAAIFHDALKKGHEEEEYTLHEHPMLAKQWVLRTIVASDIDTNVKPEFKDYKNIIGNFVARHSGQWTISKRSEVVLEQPYTWWDFLIHMCDYLGSRSNLDMTYSEYQLKAIAALDE